jgi:hypothetical protein
MAVAQAANTGPVNLVAELEQRHLSHVRADVVDALENHILAAGILEYFQYAIDQHIHFIAGVTFGKEQGAGRDGPQFTPGGDQFTVDVG